MKLYNYMLTLSVLLKKNINSMPRKKLIAKGILGALLVFSFCVIGLVQTSIRAEKPSSPIPNPPPPTPTPTVASIIVMPNQPNIKTLEQAHYLLAQMHRRNLDLKATGLGNLDPNAINGISIDALRTLLSVSAEYDQALGLNNSFLKDEKTFNASRRQQLLNRQASLEDQSLNITRQIAELKLQKLRVKTEEEKTNIQTEIDELTIVQEVVKEQLTQTNSHIQNLSNTTDKFESPKLEDNSGASLGSGKLEGVFQETVKKILDQFNNTPAQLNASVRLDNYIQMQYEVLSKQLTLLRDEVGPGERLIFMELPQTINVANDKVDNKWAQTWWKIESYSQCIAYKGKDKEGQTLIVPCSKVFQKNDENQNPQNQRTLTTADIIRKTNNTNNDYANYERSLELTQDDLSSFDKKLTEGDFTQKLLKFGTPINSFVQALLNDMGEREKGKAQTPYLNYYTATKNLQSCLEKNKQIWADCAIENNIADKSKVTLRQPFIEELKQFVTNENILKDYNKWYEINERIAYLQNELPANSRLFRRIVLNQVFGIEFPPISTVLYKQPKLEDNDRTFRAIDLLPRQSALNVNNLSYSDRQGFFKVFVGLLNGIGIGGNYQRQRERYTQFVQQELYSSAFGKGAREFGWTFNPMPYTKKLISGDRTTYAVAIVPEDTTSIDIASAGCYFPRASEQFSNFPDNKDYLKPKSERGCFYPAPFTVSIPDGSLSNKFYVTGLNYKSVKKGDRAVVTIYGRNFSSQIGILINGVSLGQSLGLGQPFILDDSSTGRSVKSDSATAKVNGSFERIDSDQLVATFEMDKDYEGTPTITLVEPGKAVDINVLNGIRINSDNNTNLREADHIFGIGKDSKTSITGVNIFQLENGNLKIVITGKHLQDAKKIYVNGQDVAEKPESGTNPPPSTPGTPTVSLMFTEDDFKSANSALIQRLANSKKRDSVSSYIYKHSLSKTTQRLVNSKRRSGEDDDKLLKALHSVFNVLLEGTSLYSNANFKKVTFRQETINATKKQRNDDDRICLNRLVLEDAYPEIPKNPQAVTCKPKPVTVATANTSPGQEKEKYLIELMEIKPPKEKTVQITILTEKGILNANPVDNPKKDSPPQAEVTYNEDETKFSISRNYKLTLCKEEANTIQASFDILGKGFTRQTKAFTLDKDNKEQQQVFTYETSRWGVLTIKNPQTTQMVILKDDTKKLKTQKIINWKKPTDGCN